MDSSDKIKILLEDFSEKEELTRAEISEIEKQIAELEELIVSSKERMASVKADKEKVYMMRNRYAGGDWSDVLEKASEKIKEQAEANLNENKDNGVKEDTEVATQPEEIKAETPEPESVDVSAQEQSVEPPVQAGEKQDPANVGVATSEVVPITQAPAQENQPQGEPVQEAQNPPVQEVPTEVPPEVVPEQPAQVNNVPAGHDVSPVALDNPNAPPILPGIPNPPTGFDAMQTPPGMPSQLQNQPAPPREEPSESLFPFSQGAGQEIDQDAPWSGIAWENSETPDAPQQPQQTQQPQQPQQQAPVQQPVQQVAQPPQQPPQPVQQAPQAVPAAQQTPPAQPQVQTQDGREIAPPKMPPSPPPINQNVADPNAVQAGGPPSVEFDISDALNPEQEPSKKKDEEKGKKINDALKGLFK